MAKRRAPRLPDDGETTIAFDDNNLVRLVCGPTDSHLARIEQSLNVLITARGNRVTIRGGADGRQAGQDVLEDLYASAAKDGQVSMADVDAAIRHALDAAGDGARLSISDPRLQIKAGRRFITPRSRTQSGYLAAMAENDLTFGLGPAGTGKTYLAVAFGVAEMLAGRVDRLILTRPAVEAGERLGFLPGDLKEKIDPYLQPLYDALRDTLGTAQTERKMASQDIEVAPLAFMRGRTLTRSFVILDEGQNTTSMQMKMFLTRLGEDAKMVVTGDPTQVDLPPGVPSGLLEACRILDGVKGAAQIRFTAEDVVRHPLVARIVQAYDNDKAHEGAHQGPRQAPGFGRSQGPGRDR